MKINDSDLFYTCSLIELIGRNKKLRRGELVSLMGKKNIAHIYSHADVLHCEPIAHTAEVFADLCGIPQGDFDNVATCKYEVPDYWAIGKVFARLAEDVARNFSLEAEDALMKIYASPVSDEISNYNSDFFYQQRECIFDRYLEVCN